MTINLRAKIIRLAHAKPELRPHLLPLLKQASPSDVYQDALKNLSDLSYLSENVQEVLDGFSQHYASDVRNASMDPTVKSEYDVFNKANQGLTVAEQTIKSLKDLVTLFPDEAKYVKTLADMEKMRDKLTKQVEASRKVIRTLSKKQAPKALSDMAKAVDKKIAAKLIDPNQLEAYFNQSLANDGKLSFLAVFVASDAKKTTLILSETVAGDPGVMMGVGENRKVYTTFKPATVDGAVDLFLNAAKSWVNVKGESESRSVRESTAKAISQIVSKVTGRMGDDYDPMEVSDDFRMVSGSYKSYLPKDGAYAVGEYEWDHMVGQEIKSFKSRLEPALAPFKDKIERMSYDVGDKSWVYVNIYLK
jgi:hypothetical protein